MALHLEDLVKQRVRSGTPPAVVFANINPSQTDYFAQGVVSDESAAKPNSDTIFEIGF